MHFLSYIINDYTYGLYKWEDKKAFVTQGIGTRGLPIRIGTRSEIVMMHLLSNLKEKE
jgi:predicted MPP superfamily phosphohydrolase